MTGSQSPAAGDSNRGVTEAGNAAAKGAIPDFASGMVAFESPMTVEGRVYQAITRADGKFMVVAKNEDGSYIRLEVVGSLQTARRKVGNAYDLSDTGRRR